MRTIGRNGARFSSASAEAKQPGSDACGLELEDEAIDLVATFRNSSQVALKSLAALMEALRPIEGAKTVVLVTAGLQAEDAGELRDVAVKAAQARVALYSIIVERSPVDPAEASAPSPFMDDERYVSQDLFRLAGLAKGEVFRSVGSAGPYERIARETSGSYLVGFAPEGADTDGKDHRLEVKVRRPGLTVRARRSLPLVAERPLTAKQVQDELAALVRAPRVATGFPLRVATYALRDPSAPAKVRLLVSAEIGSAAGAPTVGFALLRPDGHIAAQASQRLSADARVSGQIHYLHAVNVDPGTYTLRLAAVDGRGRTASVLHPVSAVLVGAGNCSMSDLVLAPAGQPAGGPVVPAAGPVATAGLAAYVEVYGPDPGCAASEVRLELARESEAPVVSLPVPLRGAGGVTTGRVIVPLSGIAPGRYVVRVLLMAEGAPAARTERWLEVAAPAAARLTP